MRPPQIIGARRDNGDPWSDRQAVPELLRHHPHLLQIETGARPPPDAGGTLSAAVAGCAFTKETGLERTQEIEDILLLAFGQAIEIVNHGVRLGRVATAGATTLMLLDRN